MEFIIPLQLSFELVRCFYNLISCILSSSGWILMLTSEPLWTTRPPFSDFIRQRPSYSISLWAFPRIHNAFGKLYPPLSQACSTTELVLFILGIYDICSPMGWTYAFPNLWELESYATGFSSDKISILQLHQEREVKWKVMHCRSGSRPWTLVFMPTDTVWNLSWKLLARIFNHLNNSSGIVNWIPCSYGPDHISSLIPFTG